MTTRSLMMPLIALFACAPDEEPAAPPGSACGEIVEGIEMSFTGQAFAADGTASVGALVELEDRSGATTAVLGSGTTGADGTYSFDASDITSIADCWLTALDYRLVATHGDEVGEYEANNDMWDAIQDGSYAVDLADDPIQLAVP